MMPLFAALHGFLAPAPLRLRMTDGVKRYPHDRCPNSCPKVREMGHSKLTLSIKMRTAFLSIEKTLQVQSKNCRELYLDEHQETSMKL